MQVQRFAEIIGSDFYTGIPDSQLKALCDYLMDVYGIDSRHHIIAANEGNCVALAAGYYLAAGKIPAVYMQNSGEGNLINPAASLLNDRVCRIPVLFIIGWRGEPGIHDEPQHVFQGEITLSLLDELGIAYKILSSDTTEEQLEKDMEKLRQVLADGLCVAIVVRKDALQYEKKPVYSGSGSMMREEVIRHITAVSGTDPVISTTGKASRELYELRDVSGQTHASDFLTVGSMGHCSSIALGVALSRPDLTVWCIDGDGAALMHMGALPVIASCQPHNLIHIIVNNGAHETVGGQPTVMDSLEFSRITRACGYPYSVTVSSAEELDRELVQASRRGKLSLIEVKCGLGVRDNLGRPSESALENKKHFMEYLRKI